MTRPRTNAAKARALHARDPSLTPSQIGQRLGMDRRAVAAALKVGGTRGRPPKGLATISLVVPRTVLDAARARLAQDGYGSIEDVLVSALAAELLPAEQAVEAIGLAER